MRGRCSVSDCERTQQARGWCGTHYMRWRRQGSVTIAHRTRDHDGRCSLSDCDEPYHAKGFCNRHYLRWKNHGSPHALGDSSGPRPSMRGSGNPQWRGDNVSYAGIHRRLRAARGLPQRCERCGVSGPGSYEWALNKFKADTQRTDRATGKPFSTDLADYAQLCRPCHRKYDAWAADYESVWGTIPVVVAAFVQEWTT